MKILVTGGMGYIGSHTVVELLNSNKEVVILDNLSNSSINVLDSITKITGKTPKFVKGDIKDEVLLDKIFTEDKFDAVIHFAGLKAVGESVKLPITYYENNVAGSICLFKAMQKANVKNIVFSSSATVYGAEAKVPYVETSPVGTGTNPYGCSKIMIEQILKDISYADPEWSIKSLRYFNPIGAHKSALIGEKPSGIPNNLLPYVTQVAIGKLDELSIYGNDYPTRDGSCLRDYIHVVDLAKGHLLALGKLNEKGFDVYNLGTGKATSVLEIVQKFEKLNNVKVKYKIVSRREGDLPEVYADPTKALEKLNWQAELDLEDMLSSSWKWEQQSGK